MGREPGQTGVYFDSHGSKLLGTMYLGGTGPRPTVVLLHGMPGIEKNFDLMYELRRRGYNALLIHYRGSWGSEGDWTFEGTAQDATAAIDHLHDAEWDEYVDRDKIVLFGHSMGGWAAVVAGMDRRVKGVCSSAPVMDPSSVEIDEEAAEDFTLFLDGVTPARFAAEWTELPSSRDAVMRLNKPLLVVHGEADDVVPVGEGKRLFEAASDPKRLELHPEADHAFVKHRHWFVETVADWVREVVGEAPA